MTASLNLNFSVVSVQSARFHSENFMISITKFTTAWRVSAAALAFAIVNGFCVTPAAAFVKGFQGAYDSQLNAAAAAAALRQQAAANDPVQALADRIRPVEAQLADAIYSQPSMRLKGWEPTNSVNLRANGLPPGVVVAFILNCAIGERGCEPPKSGDSQINAREESYCKGSLVYLRRQGLVLLDMFMDRNFRGFKTGHMFGESDCK